MPRHKRRSELFEIEAAKFVSEAAEFHRTLSRYLIALKPQAAQYRAILAVSEEGLSRRGRGLRGDAAVG